MNRKLLPEAVDLFLAELQVSPAQQASLSRLLSDDELQRAARFHFDHHRRRYIVARAALRKLLASYVGAKAEQIRFRYNEHGRPELEANGLYFNLSHSGELAAFAFCKDPVGIDIEQERQLEAAIGSHIFSPDEQSAFAVEPVPGQRDALFRCWTRKEAFVKGLGGGLSIPIREITVGLRDGVRTIVSTNPKHEADCWTLLDLAAELPSGCYGAVAARGPNPMLRRCYLEEGELL